MTRTSNTERQEGSLLIPVPHWMLSVRRAHLVVLALALVLNPSARGDDPANEALTLIKNSNARLERFVMDNGMVCLIKEDHSAPVAAVQIWVRTGSIHEQQFLGSGLSHAVEHMAFKGTAKRTTGDISRQINDAGGRVNAYTTFDRVVFHADLPARNWRVALDVLADAAMNSTFPTEEWKKEKQVILREFAMGRDDPGRVLGKLLWRTAYRVHPYQYPVIGIEQVFKQRSRDELLAFYRQHYRPDNMITVVVGDVDRREVKKALHDTYDTFERRAHPPVILPREPQQLSPRYGRETGAYTVSRLELSFHTVPLSHPDAPALDVLASVAGQGRSSQLNRVIKEERKLVHSIGAWSYTPKQPGLFVVSASFDPDKEDDVIAAIKEQVALWLRTPFSNAELDKARRQTLVSELSDLQTMKGQATSYASGEFYANDARFSETYLKSLSQLTASGLRAVARKYLRDENLSLVVLSPARDEDAPAPAPAAKAGTVTKRNAANGIPLLIREDHKLPFVYVCAVFGGGLLSETEQNNGVTRLMSDLITRGTGKRTSEQIAQEIETLGARLSAFSGHNSFGLQGQCLTADTDRFMSIFSDCLLNARFPKEEIEKRREIQLASIRKQQERPMVQAGKELREILFPGHPYRWDAMGQAETVTKLTGDDVRNHFKKLAVSGNMVIALFGDITPDRAIKLLDKPLTAVPKGKKPQLKHRTPRPRLPRLIMKEEPKEQAILLMGFPGVSATDPRADALTILTRSMSGLSSVLCTEAREKRGLVYYIGAYQRSGIDPGSFVVYAGTRKDAVQDLEELVRLEIDRLAKTGLSQDELDRSRNQIIAQHEMALQNNGGLAMTCALNELYGLGHSYVFTTRERFEKLTVEKARRAAWDILTTDRMAVSIVVPEEKK